MYAKVLQYSTNYNNKAADVAEESLSNIRTVRAFGQELKHQSLYSQAITKSYQMAKRVAIAGGSYTGVVMLAENVSLVLVLWFGGTLVLKGELSIGSLTSFLLYTQYVSKSCDILSDVYFDTLKALGATERAYTLITRVPKIECSSKGDRIEATDLHAKIEFDHVNFSYPSRPRNIILDDFCLTLNAGETVALVGESGSGKTTCMFIMMCLLQFVILLYRC